MPDHPSSDRDRTVDYVTPPEAASTVDISAADKSADSTVPHVDTAPADAPSIREYRITAEIARGGMGRVYAGHDLTLDREVAIKTLLPGSDAERFVTEAKITARLPHPGIPPVHALGTLADGAPYLAMKFIRGCTLAELLAKRRSPLVELPRFVQIFEQVAQAVGFAHAHDVIHRDLKPANVMVGELGEVQVMDWGLAKDLFCGRQERAEKRPDGEDATQTAAGAVLGTPAYMAPEQARGEVVDARADVFALGATLAAILTGQPAFVGPSTRAVIDAAARADLCDVRQRLTTSGADRELIALALACLSADVAGRPVDGRAVVAEVAAYRSGVEARLRRAETERAEALVREAEQRKQRRTIQAAGGIVAVVLLAGLSASLWQMRRAMRAEASANTSAVQASLNAAQARDQRDAKDSALKAEQKARADETQARQQAFAALRSMTADVVERKFAQGSVLTEDDRAFLRGIIAQFDAFAEIKSDDADSRAVRAEGRLRVANMRSTLGETEEAEKDYDQALVIQTQLTADFPARAQFYQDLAVMHNSRGNLLRAKGRMQEAEDDYDQALSIQNHLPADFASRPDFRQEFARSHNNRGFLFSNTGRPQEAENEYAQALLIGTQLAADSPTQAQYRQELAGCHNNRGMLLYNMGRLQEAENDWNEALRIQNQLVADFPLHPEFRRDLARSYSTRGNLLRVTGRLEETQNDYDQALSICKQLAADYPSRPEFRKDLAGTHSNRANLLLVMGRFQEAEYDYDQALAIRRQLAADFADQPDLRNELAATYVNMAFLSQMQGNSADAKRLLLEGRPHHLAALEANPQHPFYREFYRNHLGVLTAAYAGLLEREEAVRAAESCRNLGWNAPADAYFAACFLSRCISIVAQHEKLDEQGRNDAVQFYGDAAMKLLGDAVSKGYTDVLNMKKDANLAPLRQRDDFQKLIAEMEEKRE
jgi:serine/threonine protein kinase